jgi:hypothetical protein
MNNCYVFRGRIRKRFGSVLTSNLSDPILRSANSRVTIPIQDSNNTGTANPLGTTDAGGDIAGNLGGGVLTFVVGQGFTIGTERFTITSLGTPTVLATDGSSTTHTLDTTTGAYVFVGSNPLTDLNFYSTVSTTDANGYAAGYAPSSRTVWDIGQQFQIGSTIYTVNNPTGSMLSTDGTVGTFDTTTGLFTFVSSYPYTQIYFYPATSIMGFAQYNIGPINNNPAYAFDTQYVYKFANGWYQEQAGNPLWHGTDSDFFWTANWRSASTTVLMFTTNFFAVKNGVPGTTDDPIWWYDGTTWSPASGTDAFFFAPNAGLENTGPYVKTARIIVAFRNMLLLLNTIENDGSQAPGVNKHYPNRCRFSHFFGSPLDNNAWYEPNQYDTSGVTSDHKADGGGFLDAPTSEEIISAGFLKNRLIVYFERSTWELVFTGNYIVPLIWQKLNTELGSQSTFSTVPFDKVTLSIGNTGVHACTGSGVERIDNNIPDNIFEIKKSENGVERVAGIRDFYTELAYWAFPNTAAIRYPNQVLIFNYVNGSWAYNDDSITAFGYFEQQTDRTWQEMVDNWEDYNNGWNSGVISAGFRQVLGGNQQGYIFFIAPDTTTNAPVLNIAEMTAAGNETNLLIVSHNLISGDYIEIANMNSDALAGTADGLGTLIGNIYTTFPNLDIKQGQKFTLNSSGDVLTIRELSPDIATSVSLYPINPIKSRTINTITGDFNLQGCIPGELVYFDTVNGIYPVQVLSTTTIRIPQFYGANYLGGATASRVSNVNFQSKQWNFYDGKAKNILVNKVDFLVQRTEAGQITADFFISSTGLSMVDEGVDSGAIVGNNILETSPYTLYPLEQQQDRLWHTIYFQAQGETMQLNLYMSDDQMMNPDVISSQFEIDAILIYAMPVGRLE